jgi:hypothetical protein
LVIAWFIAPCTVPVRRIIFYDDSKCWKTSFQRSSAAKRGSAQRQSTPPDPLQQLPGLPPFLHAESSDFYDEKKCIGMVIRMMECVRGGLAVYFGSLPGYPGLRWYLWYRIGYSAMAVIQIFFVLSIIPEKGPAAGPVPLHRISRSAIPFPAALPCADETPWRDGRIACTHI